MELTGDEVEISFGLKSKKKSVKWTVMDEKMVNLDKNFELDFAEIGILLNNCAQNKDYIKLFLRL